MECLGSHLAIGMPTWGPSLQLGCRFGFLTYAPVSASSLGSQLGVLSSPPMLAQWMETVPSDLDRLSFWLAAQSGEKSSAHYGGPACPPVATCQIWVHVIMATFSYILCICCDIYPRRMGWFYSYMYLVQWWGTICCWYIMPIFFLNIYLLWYLQKEWVDFVHIWYMNQPQLGLDACKIYLGSVPKM